MDVVDLVNLSVAAVTLAVKLYALGDSLMRPAKAFDAVGKLPKIFWLIVLFLAAAAQVAIGMAGGWPTGWAQSWLGVLGLIGIIVALVYLFGIRPELIRYTPRRRGGKSAGGPSSSW